MLLTPAKMSKYPILKMPTTPVPMTNSLYLRSSRRKSIIQYLPSLSMVVLLESTTVKLRSFGLSLWPRRVRISHPKKNLADYIDERGRRMQLLSFFCEHKKSSPTLWLLVQKRLLGA
jgi:hypothetical protein